MTDKKAEIEGSPSKAYRFFETFPLPWKAPTRVAKALQILVVASLVTVATLKGEGVVICKCPGSKSEP